MSIPLELDEAARIDGASSLRILTTIILPLSKPALATVAGFAFIGNWTNVRDPLIYIRSQELYTLALGLNLFRGVNLIQFNLLMAVSIITLLPVLVVFFLSQRLFVQPVLLQVGVLRRWVEALEHLGHYVSQRLPRTGDRDVARRQELLPLRPDKDNPVLGR